MVGGAHPTTVHSCDAPSSTLVRSEAGAQCAPYMGLTQIAFFNQSVDRSFFIRLISPQKKMVGGAHPTTVRSCDAPSSTLVRSEASAQCAPYMGLTQIAFFNQSVDRSFFIRLISPQKRWWAVPTLQLFILAMPLHRHWCDQRLVRSAHPTWDSHKLPGFIEKDKAVK